MGLFPGEVGSSSPPKRLFCPRALSFCREAADCTARSTTACCCARLPGSESRAPALTRVSMAPLVSSLGSTRSARSNTSLKGPRAIRSATRALTADSPTPRMAASPKVILPLRIPKSVSERLMSGGRISIFIRRASSTCSLMRSVLSISQLRSAAMNSTG